MQLAVGVTCSIRTADQKHSVRGHRLRTRTRPAADLVDWSVGLKLISSTPIAALVASEALLAGEKRQRVLDAPLEYLIGEPAVSERARELHRADQ